MGTGRPVPCADIVEFENVCLGHDVDVALVNFTTVKGKSKSPTPYSIGYSTAGNILDKLDEMSSFGVNDIFSGNLLDDAISKRLRELIAQGCALTLEQGQATHRAAAIKRERNALSPVRKASVV